jgi:hypothetical protein
MNIEKIKQVIELSKLLDGESCVSDFPIETGKNVFIRTVTLYYTGKLKKVCGQFLTLENAAWIADTGRFYDFLKEGKANEVEPFQRDVHIPLSSLIDVTEFGHKLPSEQK